ncbi:MAG: type II secretion system minor pseudopilin GspH [Xanthomonadales bacterium]|nr:type II secretion system minor pseudopilin GspH [Xanthomonadales bacterium]
MRVATRGFTLIEVLVTVVILAVLASVLVLSVGAGDEEQRLQRESERLQARIVYACERAELTGRELGLHLRRGGYAFSTPYGEQWRFIEDDKALQRASLPKAITLAAGDEELATSFIEKPQFLCFASGEATPMQIEFAAGAGATRWRIDIALDGRTRLQRRAPDDRDWRDAGRQP